MKSSWPHAPPHDVFAPGIYMVTAGTYLKAHYLCDDVRLNYFCETLFPLAEKYGWSLQAWAVLSNHYHFVAKSPDEGKQSLRPLITALHRRTAIYLNEMDGCPGRKVWHNYFETPLTYQRSYYARLNYVHNNAVKHGLVGRAVDYPWCSAAWFESTAEKSFVRTIGAFKTDRVKVEDDF